MRFAFITEGVCLGHKCVESDFFDLTLEKEFSGANFELIISFEKLQLRQNSAYLDMIRIFWIYMYMSPKCGPKRSA